MSRLTSEDALSAAHVVAIDILLWFFHVVLIAIAVEEARCRMDPDRTNLLDVTQAERDAAAQRAASFRTLDAADEDAQPLLDTQRARPASSASSTYTPPAEPTADDTIMPTTRWPIAYIRGPLLWQTT